MRRAARWTVFLAIGWTTFGCREKAAPSAPSPSASGGPRSYLVGVSQCNLGEPWRVQMNADLEHAASSHPNLKLILKDAQNDSLRQRAQVEELVAQRIDLLIISPKEAAPLTK